MSMCLFVPKKLANSWIVLVLLYIQVSHRYLGKDYKNDHLHKFQTKHPTTSPQLQVAYEASRGCSRYKKYDRNKTIFLNPIHLKGEGDI